MKRSLKKNKHEKPSKSIEAVLIVTFHHFSVVSPRLYSHAEESRILQGYCIPFKDTVFHRSTEENEVLIVAREDVLHAATISADMFIQDREDNLHFSRR